MRQVFMFVVLVGIALLMVGVLVIGAFPPKPHPQSVQHAIPVEKIQPQP